MRTILLPIAALLSLATLAAPGNEGPATGSSIALERSLEHQLNKHVTFPITAHDNELMGAVEVSFVINKEGKVEVLSAWSENDRLRDYVLAKLRKVDIGDNPSGTWRTSHMRFVFRPEA